MKVIATKITSPKIVDHREHARMISNDDELDRSGGDAGARLGIQRAHSSGARGAGGE